MMNPFTPEEAEFLAENTEVDIIPNGSLTELDLITRRIDAMVPGKSVKVPLWLAINLRKSTNCQIIPPDWLNVEDLVTKYNEELSKPDAYSEIDYHYVEIAAILLEHIPNLPDSEKIRRLVQCIREARFRKTCEGLRSIDGNPLNVNKLSFMELNEIRPFLLKALDQTAKLSALEAIERQSRVPMSQDTSYEMGKLFDSQMPFSPTADINPYSEANNPYAFSTPQE